MNFVLTMRLLAVAVIAAASLVGGSWLADEQGISLHDGVAEFASDASGRIDEIRGVRGETGPSAVRNDAVRDAIRDVQPVNGLSDTYEVVRVVDGDTLVVRTPKGNEKVRLYGVDTPEDGKACYGEAASLLDELTAGGVRLESGARSHDRHGRKLAYAYTADGVSIDASLIGGGMAEAYTGDGQHDADMEAIEGLATRLGLNEDCDFSR